MARSVASSVCSGMKPSIRRNRSNIHARGARFGPLFAIGCRSICGSLDDVTTTANLSTARASALYVGALLGPSLLLLPGLAAELAGPAAILAWLLLLIVSAMLARVFTVLGTRFRSAGGVAAYT